LAVSPNLKEPRKYFGALLVGVYEDKKLKFAGRVGTGFSDKLLRSPKGRGMIVSVIQSFWESGEGKSAKDVVREKPSPS
jgi:ATP-dependent DNA ligase